MAQSNLGLIYLSNQGVKQDLAEAVKWFRMAADRSHTRAQFILGSMYHSGRGVEKNQKKQSDGTARLPIRG